MLEIERRGNIIYTYASGRLNEEDYDQMIPTVEKAIEKHGKIRWYFQVDKLEGWTPGSLWRDVKFDLKHRTDLEKIAIVGEERWHDWMAQVMKPFFTADVRYYDETERDKAEDWIEFDVPKTGSRKRKRKTTRYNY